MERLSGWRESAAIPEWTRCLPGASTPSGLAAVFRSSAHAWFALRLVYLADVAHVDGAVLAETERSYSERWKRFVRHGDDMVALAAAVDAGDLGAAAAVWASVDQVEVDDAFSTSICEREPYPKTNLAMVAHRHFAFHNSKEVFAERRDPKRAPDNQAAWEAAGGTCQSCGTATVSERQYKRIGNTLRSQPDLFDLTPEYRQTNGKMASLWSNRVLIAAKGVADHVIAWSQGGRTEAMNLANVCSACKYSRGDASLDLIGVATYRAATGRGRA